MKNLLAILVLLMPIVIPPILLSWAVGWKNAVTVSALCVFFVGILTLFGVALLWALHRIFG
jgi:hypothetical protein